ncbi:triose-phosphate isomerase [Patescibacteria group bacterium]
METNKKNKRIIIGNIKMNILTKIDRDRYINELSEESNGVDFEKVNVIICPPSIHLESFSKNLAGENAQVGAQNIHWESRGPYTGEISSEMIKDFGIKYSIVGHSERRQYFGETNEMVNLKIKSLLKNEISPIFCFGETREERGMGASKDVVVSQIVEGLRDILDEDVTKIVFAYEPIWSISDGISPAEVPTSDEVMEIKILVKKTVAEKYGEDKASEISVLYGGSVNSKNIEQVCVDSGVDGVLVGGQSLVPANFMELAKILGE